MEPHKHFETPVEIRLEAGSRSIGSVEEAVELLASVDWPGERGPRHRDAYETCLKVIDGHRSTENARRELVRAAEAAGILVGE